MPLAPGSHLGSYQVLALLGAGGMGEVYRARDTKLNRDVAIKVLPDSFANDAERLARFTREAQTLAALNHPNIAHIHGLEESGRVHALVMEVVEGEDLSAIIARGPVPLSDALPIARQIADALEAAHEQGIVHRDLKPANIKVRADGTVKVLDFGLAKALSSAGSSGAAADAMNSPTLTARATQMGMILGTAAYMAPEQARGRAVDRRADIWAFGVVLYEMLTGQRAFPGDDISDVMASVLKTEPDWQAVPATTPAPVRRLLRRCLEKDPRKRLSSIGDARLELDETESPTAAVTSPSPTARPSAVSRLWPVLAGVVVTAVVAALIWPRSRAAGPLDLTRLSILAPPGAALYPDSATVAISPDGTMVAFVVGTVSRSETQLWVRSLNSTAARRLEGGDDANLVFWSPDSRRIAFFTPSKLKTIAASGGRAEVLADAPGGRGGTWSPSNVIVYAPDAGGPLYRIAASGGAAMPVTTLDASRKQYGHRFPSFLPDGTHFLYAALPGRNGRFDVFVGSLAGGSPTLVGTMESAPVYADPGWLLYGRQGVLVAQPFDVTALKLVGDPTALDDEPSAILDPANSFTAGRPTSISKTGALAYYSAPSINTTAEWYDALGRRTGTLSLPAGHYESLSISPDGTHAVMVRSTSPSESALWLVDLARGSASPLSSGPGRNDGPVWSPDGTRVVFTADREGPENFFIKTVADAAPEQPFFRSDVLFKGPAAWSPEGQWIVVTEIDPVTAQNVWLLPAAGGALRPFVIGPTIDRGGPVSPDGHWLAYTSGDTGRFQLFVQSCPVPGHKVQVSQSGASSAWWTRDGRQLVFLGDDLRGLWRVAVEPGPGGALTVSTPVQMAELPPNILAVDAMPDRQRFLALAPERTGTGSITVVQNWRTALDKR
jgi:serine/threonine protein kinase/Tol biopolymer transport system component